MAALVVWPGALAQTPTAAPTRSEVRPEIVITATREADALLAAKVEQALERDPYLFVGHLTVSAENGVVRLEGIMDAFDMMQALRLARRIAGKRPVINQIDVIHGGEDHD